MNRYYVMKKKKAIPKALREQVWRKYIGEKFPGVKTQLLYLIFMWDIINQKAGEASLQLLILDLFVVDAIIVWEPITLLHSGRN